MGDSRTALPHGVATGSAKMPALASHASPSQALVLTLQLLQPDLASLQEAAQLLPSNFESALPLQELASTSPIPSRWPLCLLSLRFASSS